MFNSNKDGGPKIKRPKTAFFIFMDGFRYILMVNYERRRCTIFDVLWYELHFQT